MRRSLAAFVFVVGVTAPALAQPAPAASNGETLRAAIGQCGAYAAVPALPDGSTAARPDMARGQTTYQDWARPQQANLQCRRAALAAFDTRATELHQQVAAAASAGNAAEAARLNADLTASAGADAPFRAQYNTDADAYNTAVAAWQESINHFNARNR